MANQVMMTNIQFKVLYLVRKDINVNEYERLSNFTLRT
jgi:hypothetical protein